MKHEVHFVTELTIDKKDGSKWSLTPSLKLTLLKRASKSIPKPEKTLALF